MAADTTEQAPPPHDLHAEKAVLRAMLRTDRAIADIVEVLRSDDFYRPAHELIYTAILDLYGREDTVDILNVTATLAKEDLLDQAGGDTYLQALAQGPDSGTAWLKDAEKVQALAVLRRTKEAAVHIENLIAEGTADDVDRIVDTAQAEIFAATLRDRTGSVPYYVLGDVMEETLDTLEAADSKRKPGIPTGFYELDMLTNGLFPGQLIVIAGRPAMGKSVLATDLLRSASIKHNLPACLFTLEDQRVEVGHRILAAEARVALHHMRSGSMTDEDWTRLARRMPDVSAAPLYIQDGGCPTFTELRAQCRRLHAQHGIRLIVVDALHLLTYGTRPFVSRYEEISEIARCLKLLAKELHVPVIAVSELNRGPEQRTDRRPMVSDLRDSGALEDNADVVILLHRDDAYERESPRAGEADLIVAKHRHGPVATCTVAFQGHYGRFVDMAQT
ncbi:replicative DNA helicase [Streptomyces sp. NPDC050485]|uniref:replicative DNA helicase n=1 Tax=Streptomyces sp. NPDC050485 TaxID=3365617 RepID=UPI00378FACB0